jgi:DNA-binding NarL/FixJ family response regulator
MPGTADPKPTIVIVEDDVVLRETLSLVLRRRGHYTAALADGEAFPADSPPTPSCVILDMQTSGRSVSEILGDLRSADHPASILIVFGQHDLGRAARILGGGAMEMLRKPLAERQSPANPRLTPREREVLTWVAQGKSAWEIARILSIAKRTVDEHVATAMRNLGAANRVHAVAIAIRKRLIDV